MDCTCSALRKAARRLTQAYDAALAPEGLTTAQFALLGALERRPNAPPTVRELAALLGLDRTTLGHNLRPLERDGLVEVALDGEDRRMRRVRLTPAGAARRAAARPRWEAAERQVALAFGEERKRDLIAALDDLARAPKTSSAAAETEDAVHAG